MAIVLRPVLKGVMYFQTNLIPRANQLAAVHYINLLNVMTQIIMIKTESVTAIPASEERRKVILPQSLRWLHTKAAPSLTEYPGTYCT